ncbi:MAG: cob(I)yrinic acid a,c-diamide adenosyltransferase [Candidatus Yanofskybacteria bacterium]|nr:cob(I)yrinic acid a,c-diamide adenosyltransferase [Candidatus Yanofskybacteria bacterium]
MLIVITGNGKGKTTSALGQALRSVGDGKKVLMIQFIKGPWRSGEDDSHKLLAPNFKIIKTGLGFVGIQGDSLPREDHINAAKQGLELAKKEMESGHWHMLILDEVHNAIGLGLLSVNDVMNLVQNLPQGMDLILTGRDACQEFIDKADIVSEVKEIKHIFNQGTSGKKGVEW